ncbi:MAG: NAD(P)-dependent glycerol-3-phosphate dehydrogenase [Bacteroidia bacterium]|nr:NAD(P)-dependent glycerol-3-phosphate dehydrogenase [Bacteroidia bacterium]
MKIGVLGAGSWGTTLAVLLSNNNHNVTLWSWSAEDAETMRASGRNTVYLPDLPLPAALRISCDITQTCTDADLLVVSTPTQHIRAVLTGIPVDLLRDPILVNVAKGIEKDSLLRVSQVIADVVPGFDPHRYAILSGPSHAEEVAQQRPTTVVAASINPRTTALTAQVFMTDTFRVYGSDDVVGVELGGALKNVIAIGAGICDGSNFGDNTKAALITRGIAEIRRLGVHLGSDPHTFAGLSGLGDLIVTTMSRHSRNRYVGEQIGKGRKLPDILQEMRMIAEGVDTARSAHDLAVRHGVEMPIVAQMYEILFNGKDPILATQELMTRQAKNEVWS